MQGFRRNIEVQRAKGLHEGNAQVRYAVKLEVEVLASDEIDSEAILEEWIKSELSGKLVRIRDVEAKEL